MGALKGIDFCLDKIHCQWGVWVLSFSLYNCLGQIHRKKGRFHVMFL